MDECCGRLGCNAGQELAQECCGTIGCHHRNVAWHEALADPADRQRYIMLHPHPQILEPCHQKKAFHLHPRVKMCQMFGGGWATQEIMNLVGLWAENRTLLANCLCTEVETKGHRICLATWLTRRLRPQRVDQAYQNGVQSRSKWTNSGCCKLFKRSHWRHVRNWRKVKRTDEVCWVCWQFGCVPCDGPSMSQYHAAKVTFAMMFFSTAISSKKVPAVDIDMLEIELQLERFEYSFQTSMMIEAVSVPWEESAFLHLPQSSVFNAYLGLHGMHQQILV